MVAQMPDLVVTDEKRWPTMAVEVQNHKGFDRQYAIDFRKDYIPDLAIAGRVPYLMLTSQDRAFVWLKNDQTPGDAPPSLDIDMRPIVQQYKARFSKSEPTGRIPKGLLLLYLRSWIEEIIRPAIGQEKPAIPSELAPIFEEMNGGRVEEEAPSL